MKDADRAAVVEVWPVVHVCAPSTSRALIERSHCPTCNRRRPFIVLCYDWYGPDATCLGCGERFNEDGRQERPFARGWREKSKADARRLFRRFRVLHPDSGRAPHEGSETVVFHAPRTGGRTMSEQEKGAVRVEGAVER